jgi:hypothetical protein
MPALGDLHETIVQLCDGLHLLRNSARPADADWRHHQLSLDAARQKRDQCRSAVDLSRSKLEIAKGELPAAWLGGDPSTAKYVRLKRSLESLLAWLDEWQKPFRGYKMPMDSDEQDQHDDPADVRDWNEAEFTVRRLGDELRDYVDLELARSAQPNKRTPSQHAKFGCDYLDELVSDLKSHDWCWAGALRGNQYQRMAHSAAGIASKVNEHALALGLPPLFGGEVKETDPTQHEVWVRMVDPLKGDISNELVATLHQPRGANPSIIPDPFDLHRQAEFLVYVDRLKREMQRRGGDTPAQPAVGLELAASPTDSTSEWRKLLHHVREYRVQLELADDWNYGREDEINKHAKALGLQVPFERYEEHSPGSAPGFWLRVWDAFASEHTSFPIDTFDGRKIPCDHRIQKHVLKLLGTWESKATAELQAAPTSSTAPKTAATQFSRAEPDLSDVQDHHKVDKVGEPKRVEQAVAVPTNGSAALTSKGMRWQEAMKAAENHCARNPFPGVNAMAKIVGCSSSTMSKAIDRSAKLRAKLAEQEAQRKSVFAGAMSDATAASAKQTRERDPINAASTSTDDLFHRLVEQAKPSERAKLNAMTPEQRRQLIATIEHDPDEAQTVRGQTR